MLITESLIRRDCAETGNFQCFYRWHWLVGAPGVMLACWVSVSLQGLLGLGLGLGRVAGQVVETPEGMEAGLLGLLAARALLEDWVVDLKMKTKHEKHQCQAPGSSTN